DPRARKSRDVAPPGRGHAGQVLLGPERGPAARGLQGARNTPRPPAQEPRDHGRLRRRLRAAHARRRNVFGTLVPEVPVRSLLIALVTAIAAAAATAPVAGAATRECDGLQICVPIAGPWVVVPSAGVKLRSVEFQLDCPRGYIVGGLDAELSVREIDIA